MPGKADYSHVMIVPPDREGEAALDLRIVRLKVGITQCTTRKHCLLRLIEGNRTKFLPVAHELILHYDLVNGELALQDWSASCIRHAS